MRHAKRALTVFAALAVAIGIAACGGGDDDNGTSGDTPAAAEPLVIVENGGTLGGITKLTFNEGDQVRFKVESDVADEVHIHGYDLSEDVKAGGTVSFDFPATIEGVFEIELESRQQLIAELRVNP